MTRDELVIALCREAGGTVSDSDILSGWIGNHDEQDTIDAANGDTEALIRLRIECGLPIFV